MTPTNPASWLWLWITSCDMIFKVTHSEQEESTSLEQACFIPVLGSTLTLKNRLVPQPPLNPSQPVWMKINCGNYKEVSHIICHFTDRPPHPIMFAQRWPEVVIDRYDYNLLISPRSVLHTWICIDPGLNDIGLLVHLSALAELYKNNWLTIAAAAT